MLFPTAMWKAYLRALQGDGKSDAAGNDPNGYLKFAEERLEKCDALLEDCGTILDALEETLAKTPKPSDVLDWNSD